MAHRNSWFTMVNLLKMGHFPWQTASHNQRVNPFLPVKSNTFPAEKPLGFFRLFPATNVIAAWSKDCEDHAVLFEVAGIAYGVPL
jgi:hypothetical protein